MRPSRNYPVLLSRHARAQRGAGNEEALKVAGIDPARADAAGVAVALLKRAVLRDVIFGGSRFGQNEAKPFAQRIERAAKKGVGASGEKMMVLRGG